MRIKSSYLLGCWLSLVFPVSMTARSLSDASIVINMSMSLALLFPITLLGFTDINLRKTFRAILVKREFSIFMFLFSVAGVASLTNSPTPQDSALYLVITVGCFIISAIFSVNLRGQDLKPTLIAYSTIITATLVLYLSIFDLNFDDRLSGAVFNPNSIGLIAASAILTSYFSANLRYNLVLLPINTAVLLMANSRSAILGVVVGLLSFHLLRKKKSPSLLFLSFAFFSIVALVCILALYHSHIMDYLYNVMKINDKYRGISTGATGRIGAWGEAFDLFLRHPLQGVGFRAHEYFMVIYSSSHNGLIALLAELGVLGGLATGYLFLKSGKSLLRKRKMNKYNAWSLSFVLFYLFVGIFERYLFNVGNPASLVFMFLLISQVVLDKEYKKCKWNVIFHIPKDNVKFRSDIAQKGKIF